MSASAEKLGYSKLSFPNTAPASTAICSRGVDQNANLEKQLTAIGKNFLGMILHRRILELHRLMVSMGRGFPSVATRFYQIGPVSAYGLVAGWIERQQKTGRLGAGDPTMLAELFLDMLTGKHQLALLTSSFDSTSPEEIARTVKAAAKAIS